MIDWRRMCVDKLMDGPVDNPMDNTSRCPQVDAQAAHNLPTTDLLTTAIRCFYILFSRKTVLTEGTTIGGTCESRTKVPSGREPVTSAPAAAIDKLRKRNQEALIRTIDAFLSKAN